MSLRSAVIPQVDHVACVIALDGLRFGKELERLSLAKESVEEDNMLLAVLRLLGYTTGLLDDVNVEFGNLLLRTAEQALAWHACAFKHWQCLFDTL